jgi:hypothetical protein
MVNVMESRMMISEKNTSNFETKSKKDYINTYYPHSPIHSMCVEEC